MNIATAILYKYPNVSSEDDFRVYDDGSGQHITYWNVKDSSGNSVSEPTQDELNQWAFNVAKVAQKQDLNIRMLGLFTSGFTSLADTSSSPPTSRTYSLDAAAFAHYNALLSMFNSGIITSSWVKDFDGVKVTLDTNNIKTLCTDAYALYVTNGYDHLDSKEQEIDALVYSNYATPDAAIAAVEDINW